VSCFQSQEQHPTIHSTTTLLEVIYNMISFSLLLFIFSSLTIGSPIQHEVSTPFTNPPAIKPFSSSTTHHDTDACQIGARNIVQDAVNLNQTLTWEIGEVRSEGGETWCKTVMRMDYDTKWQYAVSSVDWSSHILTDEKTQALVQFAFNFETSPRVVSSFSPLMICRTTENVANTTTSNSLGTDGPSTAERMRTGPHI
jgi:hypothetical protein